MVRTLYYPIPQFICQETRLGNDEEEEDERKMSVIGLTLLSGPAPSCINM